MIGTGDVLWVELPVQRRLCPIFVSMVGLPDIHEYSAGLRVVNGPPDWGVTVLQHIDNHNLISSTDQIYLAYFTLRSYIRLSYFINCFCREVAS